MSQPASYHDSTGDCMICGAPIFKHLRGAHADCIEPIEIFWRKVCERAEAMNSRRAGRERFDSYHYAAATEILAEMRRAAE